MKNKIIHYFAVLTIIFFIQNISIYGYGGAFGDINPYTGFPKKYGAVNPSADPAGVTFLPKTGVTTSHFKGDDGDLQKGVAWPEPRFKDNNNGTVTDYLTGLMWTKNANLFGRPMDWDSAINFCNTLDIGGYNDWHLPNLNELQSIIDYQRFSPALPEGNPFINLLYYYDSTRKYAIKPTNTKTLYSSTNTDFLEADKLNYLNENPTYYWTSNSAIDGYYAWASTLNGCRTITFQKDRNELSVWPVRWDKNVTRNITILKTGQTKSFKKGDDGDLQLGKDIPNPRLIDNNDGTVTDNLTGLMWFKDPSYFGFRPWLESLKICKVVNAFGYNDWRLPNVNELKSLIDYRDLYQSEHTSLPKNNPFENTDKCYFRFWTSTTPATFFDDSQAYLAYTIVKRGGILYPENKKITYQAVWPVRTANAKPDYSEKVGENMTLKELNEMSSK